MVVLIQGENKFPAGIFPMAERIITPMRKYVWNPDFNHHLKMAQVRESVFAW